MSNETKETSSKVGYTPELGDRICAQMSDGLSLRTICMTGGMPNKQTVFEWRRKYPEFRAQYDAAVRERVAVFAEDLVEISDDGSNDWMENNDPDNPGYKFNGEHFQRSRLRVDTRKWILAKMDPKNYGERVAAELTGAAGGPIAVTEVPAEEMARRIAFTLANGLKRPEQEKPH